MDFFPEIMPWEMDLPLGVLGSSHSTPGCDGSSIYKNGRAFLVMGLETLFSTAVKMVWNSFWTPSAIDSGGSSSLGLLARLSEIPWSSGSLIFLVMNWLAYFYNSPPSSCKCLPPKSGSISPSSISCSKNTMPLMSAEIMRLDTYIWVGVQQYTSVWWDEVHFTMWYCVDRLGGCGAGIVKMLYLWQKLYTYVGITRLKLLMYVIVLPTYPNSSSLNL